MKLLKKTFHRGNKMMDLEFSVKAETRSFMSQQLVLGGMVTCQFKAEVYLCHTGSSGITSRKVSIFEMFEKADDSLNVQYRITSTCRGVVIEPITDNQDENRQPQLSKVSEDSVILNEKTTAWHHKGTVASNLANAVYNIDFRLVIEEILFSPSLFSELNEDTILADFELCGEAGTIEAHKAVLAASSPMLNTMLTGVWKETAKGKVELAGVTKETLTDLKNYIYLRVLPKPDYMENNGTYSRLEALLKLACYLMMSDLIQACSAQLLLDLTTENAFKLISLAGMYKLKALMKGILLSSHYGSVDLIGNRQFPGDWI